MTPLAPLAFACVLAVAAIGVSLFAVWRAQVLAVLADERARTRLEAFETEVSSLRKEVDLLAGEVRGLQQQVPDATAALPRAGLNLSKRSQALRMHRQGDPPSRIAAALELPRQEVDLLIKVHRIVIDQTRI